MSSTTNDPMVYERVQINDRWYEVPKPIIAHIAELEAELEAETRDSKIMLGENYRRFVKDGKYDHAGHCVHLQGTIAILEATIQRVRELCSGIYGNRTDTGKMILDIINRSEP